MSSNRTASVLSMCSLGGEAFVLIHSLVSVLRGKHTNQAQSLSGEPRISVP